MKKMLVAQQNRWYARQGRTATNSGRSVKSYHDSIDYYTDKYNSLLNGKWNHMMALAPGWTATYRSTSLTDYRCTSKSRNAIFFRNRIPLWEEHECASLRKSLPRERIFIELYNVGEQTFTWNAKTSHSSIN